MPDVTNMRQFRVEVGNFVEQQLPEEVVVIHKKVAAELIRSIALKNPRDTGRSAGNWQGGVNTNEVSLVGGESRSVDQTVAELLTNLADLKAYAVVYLWNNINYIVYLEDGHSSQAPDGFVGISIAEMEAMFR